MASKDSVPGSRFAKYPIVPGKVQHPQCQGCWRSLANEQNLVAFLPQGEPSKVGEPQEWRVHTKIDWTSLSAFHYCVGNFVCFFTIISGKL